jgi:hypothetical protein
VHDTSHQQNYDKEGTSDLSSSLATVRHAAAVVKPVLSGNLEATGEGN